jgi:hypothetical protein
MLATMWALVSIQNLSKLSMETAIKLFDLKIMQILMYGLAMIWGGGQHKNVGNCKGDIPKGGHEGFNIHTIATSICPCKKKRLLERGFTGCCCYCL